MTLKSNYNYSFIRIIVCLFISDGLTVRKRKKYQKISNTMNETIKNYHLDGNNCDICPGMKQCKRKRGDFGQIELIQKKMLSYTL